MDLFKQRLLAEGVRSIEADSPVLRAGQIVFTTYIPNADPCSPSGDSWIMKLDALTGVMSWSVGAGGSVS